MKTLILDQKAVGAFVAAKMKTDGFKDFTAIGLGENGALIAGVIYNNFSSANVCMHVAAVEGRNWLNRDFLFACFDYPFNQLKVRTVVGLVPKKNKQARKFDESLGFRMTGCIPDGMPKDDLLLYTMTRSQCRWLGIRSNLRKAA